MSCLVTAGQISHWHDRDYSENLEAIKNLRKEYQHYPYLYEYDDDAEAEHHANYLRAKACLDAFVHHQGGVLTGISIGCPVTNSGSVLASLEALSVNVHKAYYFGDILVCKNMWGQGIARMLYQQHIAHVTSLGYEKIIALLVERDSDDRRKPAHFHASTLWRDHGFQPTNAVVELNWMTRSLSAKKAQRESHTLRVYERCLGSTR